MSKGYLYFSFPGCYVVCNTSYKDVAHISFAGNINYLIDKKSIPLHELDSMMSFAQKKREEFIDDLNQKIEHDLDENTPFWNKHGIYERMMDFLNITEYVDFIKHTDRNPEMSRRDKMLALAEIYIKKS